MVGLIYNIPRVNDGEQPEENNNDNAIKYLESNKGRILDLAEKNYEKIVEALTNDAITTIAAASSYNPTLSLLQSSSMFPGYRNKVIPIE